MVLLSSVCIYLLPAFNNSKTSCKKPHFHFFVKCWEDWWPWASPSSWHWLWELKNAFLFRWSKLAPFFHSLHLRGSHIHSAWIGLPVSGPWSIVPVFVFSVFVFYKKSGKFCSSLLCSVLDSVVAYYCLQMYNALFPDDKDEILLRTIKTKT